MLKIINECETTLERVFIDRSGDAVLTGSPLGPGTPLIPAGPRSPCNETKKIQNTDNKMQAGETTDRNQCGCVVVFTCTPAGPTSPMAPL